MALSLITVMLYMTLQSGPLFEMYQLKVGGLNATELSDLKTLSAFYPASSEKLEYGAWSANFRMSDYADNTNYMMNLPPVHTVAPFLSRPVHTVAPFLSRIKSWGYRITFFNGYAGEMKFETDYRFQDTMPLLSYTWMLEK